MGGSASQPADHNLKKKKEEIWRKREKLLLYLETYVDHIGIYWEQLPHIWYRDEIHKFLDLIEKRIDEFDPEDRKLLTEIISMVSLIRMNINTKRMPIMLKKMRAKLEEVENVLLAG